MGRSRAMALLLGVVLASGLSSCQRSSPQDEAYLTSVAEFGDVRDVVPATGTLTAPGGAEIRAQAAGVIDEVKVREGERVAAGTLLATLKASTVRVTREEEAASAEASAANIRQAQAALANAISERDRLKSLVDRGYASSAALARAEGGVAQARAGLDASRAQAAASAARMRRAASEATITEIRAPVAGIVTFSRARPGLQVAPADSQPLFQTADRTDELDLEVLVAEPDMGRVSMKSQVSFTVDAYPSLRNLATLVSIGSAPLRQGRFVYYRALAKTVNPGGDLLPGMTATVELVRADARNVLRIPARATSFRPPDYFPEMSREARSALEREFNGNPVMMRAAALGTEFGRLLRSGKWMVFVLEGGKPVRREVRIGGETEDYVEILEGLKAGDVVILGARPPPGSVSP
jgi:HlyD family secretion protein